MSPARQANALSRQKEVRPPSPSRPDSPNKRNASSSKCNRQEERAISIPMLFSERSGGQGICPHPEEATNFCAGGSRRTRCSMSRRAR